MTQIKNISELKKAPYNPRRISAEAKTGLKNSISRFGDIAGIVFNHKTQNLVCGHQRVDALMEQYGDLEIEKNIIKTPAGEYRVRFVDWDEEKEKTANMAANNPFIAGVFDDNLEAILAEIKEKNLDDYEAVRLGNLAALGIVEDFAKLPSGDIEETEELKKFTVFVGASEYVQVMNEIKEIVEKYSTCRILK